MMRLPRAVLIALPLTLGACGLHPLYAGGGAGPVAGTLSAVEVPPIEGKAGWLVGNALRDRLGATGSARYRLDIKLDDSIVGLGVRRDDSVSRERRTLRARYQLVSLADGKTLLDATAGSDAGIDAVGSEYATIAAESSALERLSTTLADKIVARIAVYAAALRHAVKANAGQIRTALDRPSPDIRLYLLHGPDEAAAGELARRLAAALGPDAERIDLDSATLKSDPARLADEAASLSLFGGVRHIRAGPIGDESVGALEALLTAEQAGNPVVALAPAVRTTSKIVKLAIESRRAMAFACYLPEGEAADRILLDIAQAHGLRATPAVARRIADGCGGDRAVMTREIEKLALFLDADVDRPADLDQEALTAIGADLGEADAGHATAALVGGDAARFGAEIARLTADGGSPIPWLRAIARRLITLAEMRAEIDAGESLDAVMKRHRVFGREEALTARALRRWSPPMLAQAMGRVRAAERAVMAPGNAGPVLADAAALGLARDVARRG